jgi:F0F1-type ATP synthase membrane subunit c/vacuolar-type H+-ATPase subunit K
MTRFVAAGLAAALAAALAGCGDGKSGAPAAAPDPQQPKASEMFDKKRAPPVGKGGKPAGPG